MAFSIMAFSLCGESNAQLFRQRFGQVTQPVVVFQTATFNQNMKTGAGCGSNVDVTYRKMQCRRNGSFQNLQRGTEAGEDGFGQEKELESCIFRWNITLGSPNQTTGCCWNANGWLESMQRLRFDGFKGRKAVSCGLRSLAMLSKNKHRERACFLFRANYSNASLICSIPTNGASQAKFSQT